MTAGVSTAEAIFLALADLEPADRVALLDARCGGDTTLRLEVEAMVASLDLPDEAFLDPARIPTLDMAAVDGPLQPGTSLGDFHVLHALGSGGMGVVYAAQQDRPRRTVAIKVLRRGFRHREMLRRFEFEAEMLGRLQHPGIAQVYAFCAGDRTTPAHLVMELVAGPPVTDYARAHRLSTAARVALAIKLCAAVQHAHERGVIHRDLKPANVLVAEGGQPKVLDFGIARATAADVQRLTIQTAHGQLMGTLAYMSPEQLRGRSADVDVRSDVYALGVLLYRLLAERLPFEVADVPWGEAVQCVLESTPVPMTAADPSLAGPIERIVARAMSRDREQRYQTAAELAADLQRFLDGREPIASAHVPESTADPRVAEPAPPTIVAGRAIVTATRDGRLVACATTSGSRLWTSTIGVVRSLAAPAGGQVVAAGLVSGAIALVDPFSGQRVASLDGHGGAVDALAFSDDGRHLTSVGSDGVVRRWDVARAQLVTTRLQRDPCSGSLAVLPDGRVAVAWSDGRIDILAPDD